jgi:hypothetical protein
MKNETDENYSSVSFFCSVGKLRISMKNSHVSANHAFAAIGTLWLKLIYSPLKKLHSVHRLLVVNLGNRR